MLRSSLLTQFTQSTSEGLHCYTPP